MVSNMSELDESGNDVDDDEEAVIVPQPHYYSIWDCPHINKFTLEGNGVVKNGWRCDWCMNPPAMFLTFSATKALALAYVLRLPGSDVCPCTGIIPKTFMHGYKDLYTRKMEFGRSRSDNRNSVTDSIENIQERPPGAILVASAGVCLAAAGASASKRGVLV